MKFIKSLSENMFKISCLMTTQLQKILYKVTEEKSGDSIGRAVRGGTFSRRLG